MKEGDGVTEETAKRRGNKAEKTKNDEKTQPQKRKIH